MLVASTDLSSGEAERILNCARDASAFLKALGHEDRLTILCHLATREMAVGELEDLTRIRQTALSQHLARLRQEGLISGRREGRAVHYSLANENSKRILGALYDAFCGPNHK